MDQHKRTKASSSSRTATTCHGYSCNLSSVTWLNDWLTVTKTRYRYRWNWLSFQHPICKKNIALPSSVQSCRMRMTLIKCKAKESDLSTKYCRKESWRCILICEVINVKWPPQRPDASYDLTKPTFVGKLYTAKTTLFTFLTLFICFTLCLEEEEQYVLPSYRYQLHTKCSLHIVVSFH